MLLYAFSKSLSLVYSISLPPASIFEYVRGLSVKFVDIANKTHIVYHRLMKFCINKYQLSDTMKTQYDSLFLNIDLFFGHLTEQGYVARSAPKINVHTLISIHF